jgi:hypothetical protein
MDALTVSTNAAMQASAKPWVLRPCSLSVFYGCPQMPRLSHYFLPRFLLNGTPVVYLDGANQAAPLLIARFARERGREPADFNRLIRISRAFTCFQLTELIERAPDFLEAFPAKIIMVTALPDLYFDDDVRDREAHAAFERALEALRHPALRPLSVVVFSDATSIRSPRQTLLRQLTAQADEVVKVEPQPGDTLVFNSEKTGPQAPI